MGLYWIHPVRLLYCYSVCHSLLLSFPLNILRTNGQTLTKFCMHINIRSRLGLLPVVYGQLVLLPTRTESTLTFSLVNSYFSATCTLVSSYFFFGQLVILSLVISYFLAHLSRRLRGELIVHRSSRRPCVRLSVCVFTLSNMNISETNGSITTKFYLKHHWSGGLAA